MKNINFKERLSIVKDILKDCPYEMYKTEIRELFEKTSNTKKDDILLRLIVIDSCYSTNMNKRLFGFEELAELLLETEPLFSEKDVLTIIEKYLNEEYLLKPIGIDKKGKDKGHSFSLISKYLFFRTNFQFPIFDSLVFRELKEENLIKGKQYPTLEYFKILMNLKSDYKKTIDELDQYFWVCGKVRKGSLSLLISDEEKYKSEFLNQLFPSGNYAALNSKGFDKKVSNLIKNSDVKFKDKKLKLIQELGLSLKHDWVLVKKYSKNY